MIQFAYHLPPKIVFWQAVAETLLVNARAANRGYLVSEQGLAHPGLVQKLKEAIFEGVRLS